MIKFIFIFPILAFGQMEFFGYYETEYDHLQLKGKNYNFGYNKLRLDLESRSNESMTIATNINFRLYHGKIEWNPFDFPMDTVEVDGEQITSITESLLDEIYLNNIYLRFSF